MGMWRGVQCVSELAVAGVWHNKESARAPMVLGQTPKSGSTCQMFDFTNTESLLGPPKQVVPGVLGELEQVQGGRRHLRRGLRTTLSGRSSLHTTTANPKSFGESNPNGRSDS